MTQDIRRIKIEEVGDIVKDYNIDLARPESIVRITRGGYS